MIKKSDFEASWVRISTDYECDWCGWFIYRNESTLVIECGQRGLAYYCGHGCEGNHRDRINSRLEAVA